MWVLRYMHVIHFGLLIPMLSSPTRLDVPINRLQLTYETMLTQPTPRLALSIVLHPVHPLPLKNLPQSALLLLASQPSLPSA